MIENYENKWIDGRRPGSLSFQRVELMNCRVVRVDFTAGVGNATLHGI